MSEACPQLRRRQRGQQQNEEREIRELLCRDELLRRGNRQARESSPLTRDDGDDECDHRHHHRRRRVLGEDSPDGGESNHRRQQQQQQQQRDDRGASDEQRASLSGSARPDDWRRCKSRGDGDGDGAHDEGNDCGAGEIDEPDGIEQGSNDDSTPSSSVPHACLATQSSPVTPTRPPPTPGVRRIELRTERQYSSSGGSSDASSSGCSAIVNNNGSSAGSDGDDDEEDDVGCGGDNDDDDDHNGVAGSDNDDGKEGSRGTRQGSSVNGATTRYCATTWHDACAGRSNLSAATPALSACALTWQRSERAAEPGAGGVDERRHGAKWSGAVGKKCSSLSARRHAQNGDGMRVPGVGSGASVMASRPPLVSPPPSATPPSSPLTPPATPAALLVSPSAPLLFFASPAWLGPATNSTSEQYVSHCRLRSLDLRVRPTAAPTPIASVADGDDPTAQTSSQAGRMRATQNRRPVRQQQQRQQDRKRTAPLAVVVVTTSFILGVAADLRVSWRVHLDTVRRVRRDSADPRVVLVKLSGGNARYAASNMLNHRSAGDDGECDDTENAGDELDTIARTDGTNGDCHVHRGHGEGGGDRRAADSRGASRAHTSAGAEANGHAANGARAHADADRVGDAAERSARGGERSAHVAAQPGSLSSSLPSTSPAPAQRLDGLTMIKRRIQRRMAEYNRNRMLAGANAHLASGSSIFGGANDANELRIVATSPAAAEPLLYTLQYEMERFAVEASSPPAPAAAKDAVGAAGRRVPRDAHLRAST